MRRFQQIVVAVLTRRRHRLIAGLVAFLVTALGASYMFHRPLFLGNVGEVAPGVFRSAQPDPEDWEGLLEQFELASVLNLRGGWTGNPWYAAEIRLGQRGVDVYDFPMSATKRPTRAELLTLLDLFDSCRYPLLIHCKSGSDRTGLACGLYLMAKQGQAPEVAREALSLDYGHVGIFGPERMHDPFVEYAAWLDEQDRPHSPETLRHWVEHVYRDDARTTRYEVLMPGPRPLPAGSSPLAGD